LQAMLQTPCAQVAVPLLELQTLPQLLQFLGSLRVSTSQPSSLAPGSGPLQSAKPGLQVYTQSPPTQLRAELLVVWQAALQAPQCVGLVFRLTSQPVAGSPSQSAKPALQLWMRHVPPMQPPVAFCMLQALLHIPQCALLVLRFVSQKSARFPSHSPNPFGHGFWAQLPLSQNMAMGGAQRVPQRPQWSGSRVRSASQPLSALESQLSKLVVQVPIAHAPLSQRAVAFASAQGVQSAAPQP